MVLTAPTGKQSRFSIVMDWLFQGKWEIKNKSEKWLPLLFHCAVYTIGFIPVFLIYKISLIWLVLLFTSHIIFDERRFVYWLLRDFKGITEENTSETIWKIYLIGTDQILHIVILMLIVIFN